MPTTTPGDYACQASIVACDTTSKSPITIMAFKHSTSCGNRKPQRGQVPTGISAGNATKIVDMADEEHANQHSKPRYTVTVTGKLSALAM